MKKLLTALLVVLLCATFFTACGAPAEPAAPASETPAASEPGPAPEAPAEEPAEASAADAAALPETFILGLDASFPPMGYLDENNEIVGVDIDLAKAVCNKLGMKFEPKPIDWDAKDMELGTDKITCIWNGLTVTGERKEAYELSDAYMDNEQVIVVMQNSEIKSKADLAGKAVAAQKDSSGLEALQKDEIFASIKDGVAKEYANYVDALTDLEIGRCDAIVMDSVVANYYITENAKPMTILNDKMASEQYAIAFKKGNTALKDTVWTALGELADEGKIAEISQKWFGRDDMIKVK